jgi:23S rRNA U2552 (ribose-2'-O)-methylase RlmE/FtsJ
MLLSRLLASVRPRAKSTSAPATPAAPAAPQAAANPLTEYFRANTGRVIDKWDHYFEIYHRHFQAFRGRSPVVVEIGVSKGGSLEMWRHYFGPGCRIVGVDVDPRCARFAGKDISILIGDQADRQFLARIRREVPHVDILIDDGGHYMDQQIATFEELYPHIQPNGIYLCEDMHSSYYEPFGGGYRRQGSFVEYSKGLIDQLYRWYCADMPRGAVADMTETTWGLHFYDSVLVIEKRPIAFPTKSQTGTPA